jgi:transcription initiation factor TFIID subunit 8
MPGIILSPSASSLGPTAGMKRALEAQPASAFAEPHRKKRRVVHHIHHAQPVHHIVEPINPETTDSGDCKDFFDQQLRRAIAVQCRGTGFDSTRPDALEEFRGLVDSCTFCAPSGCRGRVCELMRRRHDQLPNPSSKIHAQRSPH